MLVIEFSGDFDSASNFVEEACPNVYLDLHMLVVVAIGGSGFEGLSSPRS